MILPTAARPPRFYAYFFICVLFCSGIFWIPATTHLAAWSVFELLVAATALFLVWLKGTEPPLSQSLLSVRILVFTLFCASALPWTQNFHATLTSIYKLLFVYLTCSIVASDRHLWQEALRGGVLFISLIGATASIFFSDVFPEKMPHGNLVSGFFTIGCVFFLDSAYRSFSPAWKKIFIACAVWLLLAQIALYSLAPFLASAIVFLGRISVEREKKFHYAIIFLLLGIAAVSFFADPINLVSRKFQDPFAVERLSIWMDSWRQFLSKPWVGTGLGTFRDHYPEFKSIGGIRLAPYAHNEPINLLCETGVVGFAVLAWAVWPAVIRMREREAWTAPWPWILLAVMLHSLFDFNLRYPPILFLAACSLAQMAPQSEAKPPNLRVKILFSGLLALAALLFAMPGAADLYFKRRAALGSESAAAKQASRIDPFNAFYRFKTRQMRQLDAALELEPRNVWLISAAARFYWEEWKRTKNPYALDQAFEQVRLLKKYAPNVAQFEPQIDEISEEKGKISKF